MAKTKKKLKKLKTKIKELQKLCCLTESRLDRLELDVELLQANKADYDIMFEDLAEAQQHQQSDYVGWVRVNTPRDEVDEVDCDAPFEEDAIDRWNRQYQDELNGEDDDDIQTKAGRPQFD
jgi:uncharacterized protein YdiU (UPF0061 family)